MEHPTENPASAVKPDALPREQLARNVFQMPATWVCVGILLLLLGAVGRMFWKMHVGWREEAVPQAERLYRFLSSGKLRKDAPSEWFKWSADTDLDQLEGTFGPVSSYSVIDHLDESSDEETVELSVKRAKFGVERENVYVDRSGIITRVARM